MPAIPSEGAEHLERGTQIVFIGTFNPGIFQPMWFVARGLLSEQDVSAETVLVTDGFSNFLTKEFGLMCTRERWQIMATRTTPTPDILLDLATEAFSALPNTPIGQVGINHQAHIPKSQQTWDNVVGLLGDPQLRLKLIGGQSTHTVEFRSERDDGFRGTRSIVLQPSEQLLGGVWFQINDHVSIVDPPQQPPPGSKDAVETLRKMWEGSRDLVENLLVVLAPDS